MMLLLVIYGNNTEEYDKKQALSTKLNQGIKYSDVVGSEYAVLSNKTVSQEVLTQITNYAKTMGNDVRTVEKEPDANGTVSSVTDGTVKTYYVYYNGAKIKVAKKYAGELEEINTNENATALLQILDSI